MKDPTAVELTKKMLFIRATGDIDIKDIHLGMLKGYCQQFGIEFILRQVYNHDTLNQALHQTNKVDYLLLGGHGESHGFGNNNGFEISWQQLTDIICESNCLNSKAQVILYCCKGGQQKIACSIIQSCPNIENLIGVKEEYESLDLLSGMFVFLYNRERMGMNPRKSMEKASNATSIDFEFYAEDFVNSEGHLICQKCYEQEENC